MPAAPRPRQPASASDFVPDGDTGKKPINLLRGWPAPSLLPAAQLRAAAGQVLADPDVAVPMLEYAIDPGFQPLREELARWLGEVYPAYSRGTAEGRGRGHGNGGGGGLFAADEIAITGGASQGLACLLQSYTDPLYTRAVWVVAPCYFLACPIFEDAGFRGRLRAVPEDDGGIDLAALERGLKEEDGKGTETPPPLKRPYPARKLYRHVIYLVATCANPSGKTLSLPRREALVRLAREHDALIISDDVYDFLQWPVASDPSSSSSSSSSSTAPSADPLPLPKGCPLPLLSQIDNALPPSPHNPPGKSFGHAVSNASFSKLVGPGTRTGWIHAAPDFAYGFSQTGSNRSGGAPSQFAAVVIWRMLRDGAAEAWVEGVVRPALRRRHALMLREVRRVLEPLGAAVWRGGGEKKEEKEEGEVYGGYFVWVTLPEGVDASVAAERARKEEALVVAPGRMFEVAGDEETARFPRNVRLSFSWEEEEEIVEGVRRLGAVIQRMLEEGGGNREVKTGGTAEEDSAAKFK
ncbi:hypothetical protein VTJ83DRAFT_4157 [Remersonia thermophila]|uniref:Aminotransferase class I/classII large domain-containing protein n=1 Tax=Remersonia thermophila TaxID=72144 RepID=A0ABR4D9U8_9PEZI